MPTQTTARRAALAALITATALPTTGCGLVMMGVATRSAPAPHRLDLAGTDFPAAPFKAAAQQAGGVITVDTREYLRAELREAEVVVELQQLRAGQYQLVGSALTGGALPRLPFAGNKVEQTTRQLAEQIVAAGYRLLNATRETP